MKTAREAQMRSEFPKIQQLANLGSLEQGAGIAVHRVPISL